MIGFILKFILTAVLVYGLSMVLPEWLWQESAVLPFWSSCWVFSMPL